MTPARRGMVVVWVVTIGTLGLADWLLDRRRDGSTLSECTRWTFRTHHPAGRVAFVAAWCALSTWLVPHILKRPPPDSA